ncbi:hypothetical protein Q9R32_06960, partial [Actinotalea sp. AC32]|nr:hypothetical protein [Actinotalea sp. AC32]
MSDEPNPFAAPWAPRQPQRPAEREPSADTPQTAPRPLQQGQPPQAPPHWSAPQQQPVGPDGTRDPWPAAQPVEPAGAG